MYTITKFKKIINEIIYKILLQNNPACSGQFNNTPAVEVREQCRHKKKPCEK